MTIPFRESGVLRACLDLLAVEKIWAMRMNCGGMWNGKRMVTFGVQGMGDIFALPRVDGFFQPLWIECKSAVGKQSREQKWFEQWATGEGHQYLIVRDASELRAWLINHGVIQPNRGMAVKA